MKGHLKKRGKNSWSIVITLGRDAEGKLRQKWHTVRGPKREAQRKLNELLDNLDKGTYVEPSKVTVKDFLNDWLRVAASKVNRKTHLEYEKIVNRHLIPNLGHIKLQEVKPKTLDLYYAKAQTSGRADGKGGLSNQTVLNHHRVLSRAFKQAVRWRLLAFNPATDAEPPVPQAAEMRALDAAETATLLRAADGSRVYAPALVAVTTGLRRGELLGLKWPDIDFDAGELSVRRSLEWVKGEVQFKPPKTAKSRRKVSLPDVTVEALRAHRADQARERLQLGPDYQDNGLVFAWFDGNVWIPDRFTAAFRRLVNKAGIGHLRFHDLRHSHATQLLKEGVHPKVVSERLGHATIAITLDTYSHVLPGLQEDAASRVDAAFKAAMQNAEP